MEFNKLKGFWKSSSDKSSTPAGGHSAKSESTNQKKQTVANANSNNNSSNVQRGRGHPKGPAHLEALDEIRPEVTSEGYGLRTPYGTHLNLDFVKYCEDLATGQTFKRTSSLRKPRSRTTSSSVLTNQNQASQHRLAGGPSNESLDSLASEGGDASRSSGQAENTLMETRRRLEAFRSFRTKRHKSSDHPPQVNHQNGYSYSRGTTSPGSSSGSLTPNSLGNILGGNQVTPQHLQIVREQMSAALSRLRELEDQVKTIPVLQVKISVLQQEKKHLLEELHKKEQESPASPINGYQIHRQVDDGFESPDAKLSPRKSILSTSSGISSSSSSQSSINSPRSPNNLSTLSPDLQRSSSNDAPLSPKKKIGPPPPPKRKYRSMGVGDSSSIWDVVCYSRLGKPQIDVGVLCDDLLLRNPSSDASSMVEPIDIDAAFNIFPPPPKEYVDAGFNMEERPTRDDCVQTNVEMRGAIIQTEEIERITVACGDHVFFETREQATETAVTQQRDFSCSVIPPPISTSSVGTCTEHLISLQDACVGEQTPSTDAATSPVDWPRSTVATGCEGLVELQDSACGLDNAVVYSDAAVETEALVKDSRTVGCDALPGVELATVGSNTGHSEGRWCSYSDSRSVASGIDQSVEYVSSASNTEVKSTHERGFNTDPTPVVSIAVSADIRPLQLDSACNTIATEEATKGTNTPLILTVHNATCTPHITSSDATTSVEYSAADVCTNTKTLETSDTSTNTHVITTSDVTTATSDPAVNSDPGALLREKFTNTLEVATESNATQYDSGVYDDDDELVTSSTRDAVVTRDMATDTADLEVADANAKEIDSYVDKVQSLLAEQQNLLAENYEEIADVWEQPDPDSHVTNDRNSNVNNAGKVSRFVNPAFDDKSGDAVDSDQSGSPKSPAIAASFSLMTSSTDDDDSEENSDDEYDAPRRPYTLPPLPSPGIDIELKSIMKKPGTPVGEKKFLRFAEGVKSDESSDEFSSDDEDSISDVEPSQEEEETSTSEEEEVTLLQEQVNKRVEERREVADGEKSKSQWTYSDEFVKKSEPEPLRVEQAQVVISDPPVAEVIPQATVPINLQPLPVATTTKYQFTSEVLDACDILEKHLRNPKSVDKSDLGLATTLVQQEWFRVAACAESAKSNLDDFVTDLADTSLPVLRKVVNMTDGSGNTVLHYAISHGKTDIVDLLLGIDELNVNRANQSGYTAAMLGALCGLRAGDDARIVSRLFEKSDINCHAREAGQTALMLAVSHGRLATTQLLLRHGAEVNARDDDGSTALMCAAEHDHLEIVKLLLAHPTCDATLADNDGSTALTIAMERGRKEIAILLYAQANFKSNSQRASRPRQKCTSLIPSPVRSPVKL